MKSCMIIEEQSRIEDPTIRTVLRLVILDLGINKLMPLPHYLLKGDTIPRAVMSLLCELEKQCEYSQSR